MFPFGHPHIRLPGKHRMSGLIETSVETSLSGTDTAGEEAVFHEEVDDEADEFTVTIDKEGAVDIGLDLVMVQFKSRKSLAIAGVKEGPVSKYNSENPDLQLMTGHIIVEVNGVRGNSEKMLQLVRSDPVVKITVASEDSEGSSEE